jgi:hypothetical protein
MLAAEEQAAVEQLDGVVRVEDAPFDQRVVLQAGQPRRAYRLQRRRQ